MPDLYRTTSTLSFQQYRHPKGFALWRIEIAGKLFAEAALPVEASDDRVESAVCEECGNPGCGNSFWIVRRLDDKILWIREQFFRLDVVPSFDTLPTIFVFDIDYYQKELGDGSSRDLPELSSGELMALLCAYIPRSNLALYFLPEFVNVQTGMKLVDVVNQSLIASDFAMETMKDGAVTNRVEVRFGIDVPGIPECVWSFGRSERGLCISFLRHPGLPVWFYSDRLDELLGSTGLTELLESEVS